jgi:sugar O-acyltransferase (sialic acid O-acetyltransferase NeuD family)
VTSIRAIYCAGEQGQVVVDILRSDGEVDDIVFLDDDTARQGDSLLGIKVVGDLTALDTYDNPIQCLVAFGDRQEVRLDIAERIASQGHEFFTAVHSAVTVSKGATLGDGVIVNAQSYIGPDVTIGDHVLVDSCVNISHDSQIDVGATITPNVTIAGGVSVGRDAYIGPGATIIEDVHIGSEAVVGAGAVVTESVDERTTVVGVPAEPL